MSALRIPSIDLFSPQTYCMHLPAVYRDQERMAALFAKEMTRMVRGQELEAALSSRIQTVVVVLLAGEPIFQDGSPERIAQVTAGAMHFLQHINQTPEQLNRLAIHHNWRRRLLLLSSNCMGPNILRNCRDGHWFLKTGNDAPQK